MRLAGVPPRVLPRVLLGGLLVAITSGALVGCESEPQPEVEPGARLADVTPGALLAVVEDHLGGIADDVEVGRIRPPECPSSYVRRWARGTIDGRRLWVQLEFGKCPRGSDAHLACGSLPAIPGRAIQLDGCVGRTLEDASTLVAGRHDVYQESSSLLAVLDAADRRVLVGTAVGSPPDFTLDELLDIASAPALARRVDPAYVARGRELTGR